MSEKDKAGTEMATAEQLQTARAEGAATATKEAEAKHPALRAEGAIAERSRIKSILTGEAATDRAQLAQHLAFETDMTAEAAGAMLAKAAPEAVGSKLAANMPANPVVGQDADKLQGQGLKLITSAEACALFGKKQRA